MTGKLGRPEGPCHHAARHTALSRPPRSNCPSQPPVFAATARVSGRQLQKRYVLRSGARCRVNIHVRRRMAVLVRGGGVCVSDL
ncbi:hypothetical protein HPB50_004720 [Hyalomma asiaticum]|uniref:Uncharacterized protein n=1 Tax=Hyalomma asiaticum TaxID=266040 RepID=A0ACB7STE3_HYAAI|nr:hypothetical protein HPB50_004720 [Hyalomma asiaticum]